MNKNRMLMNPLLSQRKYSFNEDSAGGHADQYLQHQQELKELIDENQNIKNDLEQTKTELTLTQNKLKQTETALHATQIALEQAEKSLKQAHNALQSSEEECHNLSSQLIEAQENERKQMAFELHDVLGKSLTAIKFSVEHTLLTMREWGNKKSRDQLQNVVTIIQETIKETRDLTKNLWPPVLDDLGILATISWYSREFEKIYPWLFVSQSINIEENQIPDHLKIVIFRILQEAMTNSIKHSGCKNIKISLDFNERTLFEKRDQIPEEKTDLLFTVQNNQSPLEKNDIGIRLVVADDGQGFSPDNHHHTHYRTESNYHPESNNSRLFKDDRDSPGLGLLSMKERCRLSGGIFRLESACGSGTTITVLWPARI
ncbi:MAG: hypothetical protein HQK65_16540, partial [Desulfamplus sp.]|nr:hypothetical protein [Desulfamplus sp.]